MHITTVRCGLVVLACLIQSAAAQTTRVLRVQATTMPLPGDGSTWATAYPRLEEALAAATPGTEIWVAAGTYSSTRTSGRFTIGTGVRLYGGFAGVETSRDQRNPVLSPTILSGNSRNVIVCRNVTGVVIDGFTLRNGGGTGERNETRNVTGGEFIPGGGFHIHSSQVTFANCTITSNFATGSNGGQIPYGTGDGGAGVIRAGSNVRFENCEFSSNRAFEPMAGCQGGSPYTYGNRGGDGGAVVCDGSSVVFEGCVFSNNSAGYGPGQIGCISGFIGGGVSTAGHGGAIAAYGGTLVIDRCVFRGNSAGGGGGGGGTGAGSQGCFQGAQAGNGGAVFCSASAASITNSVFVNNGTSGGGGNSCNGSGAGGGHGSGVYSQTSSLILANCTFVGNSNVTRVGVGAYGGSHSVVQNCIFWGNQGNQATIQARQINMTLPADTYRRCIVQGLESGFGFQCLAADPLFADADGPNDILGDADDRLDVVGGSPAIDAGFDMTIPALDLAGRPRYRDLPSYPNATQFGLMGLDIGAYESVACPADQDNGSGTGLSDGSVTLDDLTYFLARFSGGDGRADLDDGSGGGVLDGGVTIDDLIFFLEHFAQGC